MFKQKNEYPSLFEFFSDLGKQCAKSVNESFRPPMAEVTEKELTAYARKCQERYPEAVSCYVACVAEPKQRRYRIAQIMLDLNEKAIAPRPGETLGRIFYAESLGAKVKKLMETGDGDGFNIALPKRLEYDELCRCADQQRAARPETVKSAAVTCLWLEEKNVYKVVLLPLDDDGKAIAQGENDVVGRVWYAAELDEMISSRLQCSEGDCFTIALTENDDVV